jgi:hypothetical protein
MPKSVPWVSVFVRLKASVAPAAPVMAAELATEPAVPPSPSCSVPALMLVLAEEGVAAAG